MSLVQGTQEGIYVENQPKGHDQCHYYQKCMWCGLKYKEGDDVVDAMYLTKEGFQWSGDSIHRVCDEERYDATIREIKEIKKEKRMERLKFLLKIDMN